ncbi:hypothetical protein ACIBEJ_25660 [Nonomuraea sp. NPDC050790]|uniref:hypothetical protein n=1 Tax=Nonomuraea sp. NPDC050790 TaxID=3364371 RepID=UPI0037AD2AD5
MDRPWWEDDERLLAALGQARRAAEEVPPEFVSAAKGAYLWRDVEAELAALVYDSALDSELLAVTRGGQRVLIFRTGEDTIEAEVGPETLLGQLLPPRPGSAECQLATGQSETTPIDESGCFVFPSAPPGAFRIRCRTDAGVVRTPWVTGGPY